MARLSLWRPNHSNDYNFFDKRIFEMFVIGGTDINIHKYLGPTEQTGSTDATIPVYPNQSAKNIEDLLFLENRDRTYDTSIYTMRGVYRVNDNDFDLSQFGLFLTSDTLFIVFHLNDMVAKMGRKIIVGDVLEMPHLMDFYPLDGDLPAALKRFYVVQDATMGSEGFAPTWWGHLWRVKVQPMVDSQEYKDILNLPANDDPTTTSSLGDLLSTYGRYININEAIVTQAEVNVPESGYDTSSFFVEPNTPNAGQSSLDTSNYSDDSSDLNTDTSSGYATPTATISGYLTGNGLAPNGLPVSTGIAFPFGPEIGEYFLRVDYYPNRLFRFDGARWTKIADDVRTPLTPGITNKTQISSFVNNDNVVGIGRLNYDAIRCSPTYAPLANTVTASFNMSSMSVVTTMAFNPSYDIKTTVNNTPVTNTTANISGNIGFTITTNISLINGDLLEYNIYASAVNERQSLSHALRPQADN